LVCALAEGWAAALSASQAPELATALGAVVSARVAMLRADTEYVDTGEADAEAACQRRLLNLVGWSEQFLPDISGGLPDSPGLAAQEASGGLEEAGVAQAERIRTAVLLRAVASLVADLVTELVGNCAADILTVASSSGALVPLNRAPELEKVHRLLSERAHSLLRALMVIGSQAGKRWAFNEIAKIKLLNEVAKHKPSPPAKLSELSPAQINAFGEGFGVRAEGAALFFLELFTGSLALSEQPAKFLEKRLVKAFSRKPASSADPSLGGDVTAAVTPAESAALAGSAQLHRQLQAVAAQTAVRLGHFRAVRVWATSLPRQAQAELPASLLAAWRACAAEGEPPMLDDSAQALAI